MESIRRKRLTGPTGELQPDTSQTNGSHVVTLDQNLRELPFSGTLNEAHISDGYHLTARVTNSQLSHRQLGLVLEVLEYQMVTFGVNLGMLLALSELYFRILGNKRRASEVNDGKLRTVVTVAEVLLKTLGSSEFSLDPKERTQVPEEIKKLLKGHLMSKRTYGSRYKNWRPEKLVRVTAVPVSVQFEREPNSSSKRYSGYTKGYGESHGNAHRSKTKPSAELDGEQDLSDSAERNLKHRMIDPEHQSANSLWIKFMNWLGEKL